MGLKPDFKPAAPVCNQTFTIDLQIGNKGLAAAGATTVGVVDSRAADGMVFLREEWAVPALAASSGTRLLKPVKIMSAGSHILTFTIDPRSVVVESNEADNVIVDTYFLSIGSCPKL